VNKKNIIKAIRTEWSATLIGTIIVLLFFGSVTIMMFQSERLKMAGWSFLACGFIAFMIWMISVIIVSKWEAYQ
jgi:hypothetical protein